MLASTPLLFLALTSRAALASPLALILDAEQRNAEAEANPSLASRSTPAVTGMSNRFFYSFWTDGKGSVTYNNGAEGAYDVQWSNVGNFVAGKGWNPGSADRNVTYTGTWSASSVNSYISLYGWTRNPLIEYYIVESFGSYDPSSAASKKGTVVSDGASYTILQTTRTNQPSIDGTRTFQQYWSVRTSKRVGGTVTLANHIAAWRKVGMEMGREWNYQILATEGYGSSGSAKISVSGP